MKYMTFNSSCSYCCLANLLEPYGIHREDRDIALEMGLPYLFSYDEAEGSYLAGAMLQGKYWFDRWLNSIGFRFEEMLLPKGNTVEHMRRHVPCMTGLKTEFGKHAMIYTGQRGETYRFLNPHRAGDGQPDELLLSEAELLEVLSEVNAIGYVERTETVKPMGGDDYEKSLACLRCYREELRRFFSANRTSSEIMTAMNTLLRPFAVDGLAMMELTGETGLAGELRLFQQECMALFRAGDCCPAEMVDLARLNRIADAYERMIQYRLGQ